MKLELTDEEVVEIIVALLNEIEDNWQYVKVHEAENEGNLARKAKERIGKQEEIVRKLREYRRRNQHVSRM